MMASELDTFEELILTLYAQLDELVEQLGSPSELAMSDLDIDDSMLLHADKKRKYNPQKAHEYYIRTRKLKGRRGSSPVLKPNSIPLTAEQLREKHSSNPAVQKVKSVMDAYRNAATVPPKFAIKVVRRHLRAIYNLVKVVGTEAVDATGIEESLRETARNLERDTR
jgi:hypothetical protein